MQDTKILQLDVPLVTSILISVLQDPTEIVLGEEIVSSGMNGPYTVKKHSFQYISIVKVLEQLLNQVDIFSQVRT